MASNFDPFVPSFVIDSEANIHLDIGTTQAQITNQGYTYNQAGFTYNQAGVTYGGLYNVNQDISPVFFNDTATLLSPSIQSIIDSGTHPAVPPQAHQGMLIGILGLTYPS